jgi:hypothetical protein
MKTLTVLLTLALTAAICRGQEPAPVIVFDPQLSSLTTANHAETKAALDQLLQKADQQLKDLDEQLKRMGDYTKVNNLKGTAAISKDISNSLDPNLGLKSTADLVREKDAITGAEVFTDSASGMIKGVGATAQKTVRNAQGQLVNQTVNRDPNKFKEEARTISQIDDYYRVRDEALARQAALEQALLETHQQLDAAEDDASVQKLSALTATLNAKLIASRLDVANANNDVAVFEKANQAQMMIDAKAKGEATTVGQDLMNRINAMRNNPSPRAGPSGRLPWGPRPSTTPPTAPVTPPAVVP